MLKSNLLETISAIDGKEMKKFSEFLQSPLFNKNPNVISLFEIIKKYHPDFKTRLAEKNLKKEKTYSRLFPDKPYNDNSMRTLMHSLKTLAERFLAYEEITSDKISMNLFLLKKLSSKESFGLMQKIISETEEIISESDNNDSEHYLKLSELQYFKDTIYSYNFALKKGQEPGKEMSYQSEFIINYFLLKILNHYYLLLNHSLLINFTPHMDMLDEIISYIRKNENYFENSSLKLSFYLVLLLRESNDEYFYT